MKCRFCSTTIDDPELDNVFVDLGTAPPSNAFLGATALKEPEIHFPLKLLTCPGCLLVQVDEVQPYTNLFTSDYVYYSSYSRSWLEHAERFVAKATSRLNLDATSLVVEIASNDGYLLQYVAERQIPCVGIEPTMGTALAARSKGIETEAEFFGLKFACDFAARRGKADLIIANNVLAHVPDLNDFVAGMACALNTDGTITIEFPHLQQLVSQRQFDTIYHEHFSYFSFHTVRSILAKHRLRIWDVETLQTHGGSLRVWASHSKSDRVETEAVSRKLFEEASAGMLEIGYYRGFQAQADKVKNELLCFLLGAHNDRRRIAGYGAAAKGNTLLNYAGVRSDLLPYVADASPHKQGRYLPGSRIPVVSEKRILCERPDLILILPWNLRDEIEEQLEYVRDWGGRFVTAVPQLVVI